MENLKIKIIQ